LFYENSTTCSKLAVSVARLFVHTTYTWCSTTWGTKHITQHRLLIRPARY